MGEQGFVIERGKWKWEWQEDAESTGVKEGIKRKKRVALGGDLPK